MPKIKREEGHISVDHVTVRQSVALVIVKLLAIELITLFFLAFYLGFFSPTVNTFLERPLFFKAGVILFFALIKMYVTAFVIYSWLYEYYDITAHRVIHTKGLIHRTKLGYSYNHIKLIGLKQGLFGKLLNFGTIHLFDRSINKEIYIYLIHNPKRVLEFLEELVPFSDAEMDVINIPGREE